MQGQNLHPRNLIGYHIGSIYRASTANSDFITPPPIAERSVAMSVSVCVCACVRACVCLSAIVSSEVHVRSSPHFLPMLPMAVARSSAGGVVIRYVLPVLWMTS